MDSRFFYLAFAFLMALVFAGSHVLGEDSWMAYLLFVPAFLILRGLRGQSADGVTRKAGVQPSLLGPRAHRAARFLRIGLALVAFSVPTALLADALGMDDNLTIWVAVIPVLLLVSLVDREYFGWSDPPAYRSIEYESQRSSRWPPTRS